MRSLEEAYHLALRIEEGQLKRTHGSEQRDEKGNEIFLNVVTVNVDCTSEVHVVEEVDEGSANEVHVVNNIQRESFAVDDCSEEIVVNGFGKQTQEVVMSDVEVVGNVAALSEVTKKNGSVIVGLHEEDVIEKEMVQQIE